MTEGRKTVPLRPGQLSVRRQRIERWACKDRSVSINDHIRQSSTSSGTSLTQKRAESSFIQADRRLHLDLYQLGEQREKLLERHNFDQKLFANKQALRHKDSPDILSTLNHVRKCCKYPQKNDTESELMDRTLFSAENSSTKIKRSRSLAAMASTTKQNLPDNIHTQTSASLVQTFLQHKKKQLEPVEDDENQTRHVQFRGHSKRGSQSAHISGKSRRSIDPPRAQSAHGIRSINSAPLITTIDHPQVQMKSPSKYKPPPSKIFATKSSHQEFRRYPERFLSQSNHYLPLLRRQAAEIKSHELYIKQQKEKKPYPQRLSRFSDGSDLVYDDAKSFLSEDIEMKKAPVDAPMLSSDDHNRRNPTKLRAPNKINLMGTAPDEPTDRSIALSRLRDLEYANLQRLIRSNSIEPILQPLSSIKTSENQHQQSMNLPQILHSIDSLRYPPTTKRPKQKTIESEKNLSKLGLLIF